MINLHLHFPGTIHIALETVTPAELGEIKNQLKDIYMKLSEIKTQIAAAAKDSQEAFGELSNKIGDLQTKIDQLVLDASDPDVTDETFLANLTTVQTNARQLAEIVPNPPPTEPA